jgi:hypothetical protein
MIGWLFNLIGGLYELFRAGWIARFRLKGRYWNWRTHTAFPVGQLPLSRSAKLKLVIEYFMWVRRIRTLR